MDKSGMNFPSCEGLVEIKHDFPRVGFDRQLGAELAPGEIVDIDEGALRETLEGIGIPEEHWGDILLLVVGDNSSHLLERGSLGSVDSTKDRGFEVKVRADDFNRTLRHELKHVKDVIAREISPRNDILYNMAVTAPVDTVPLAALNSLLCGFVSMNTESATVDCLANTSFVISISFCVAVLGLYLTKYRWDRGERRARNAEKAFETKPVLMYCQL